MSAAAGDGGRQNPTIGWIANWKSRGMAWLWNHGLVPQLAFDFIDQRGTNLKSRSAQDFPNLGKIDLAGKQLAVRFRQDALEQFGAQSSR